VGISVVICTYGMERYDDVLEAVNSLDNQDYKDFETLIVIDENHELLKKLQNNLEDHIRIIVSKKKGLSNARNKGIEQSNNEFIAFLDDDAVAEKDWLRILNKNFDDPDVMVVGGKISPLWKHSRPKWFPEELDWIVGCTYKGHPEKRGQVRNVIGCNMAFRKDVFGKVGIFEISVGRVGRKLLAGEEMELCFRILNEIPKSKIIYDPKARVFHKVHEYRHTKTYSRRRAYNEGLSKASIRKLQKEISSKNVLSTENTYTKYLLTRSIPSRLKNAIKGDNSIDNIRQINTIISIIGLVFIGYLRGRIT
jgi:cellulose synthase/poly-beta-1,6-N-acetylglucosamine synthase-like glycosyltransferase